MLPPYIPSFDKFVPGETQVLYSGPYWDHREIEAATKALSSGKWLTAGEYVARFQNEFSRKFGVKYSHMVNSGSSANLVMIAALKKELRWQDGDEIIVSPVGFPTTISAVVQNGLKPVFADIELDTLNFDLLHVWAKVNRRTRAVFISPVLGNPPDIDSLRQLSKKFEVKLIGDNCDSLGSKWNGEYLNAFYYAWSSSFYPAHHITTGEGGMVSTNDVGLMKTARSISWWGRDCYCVGQANALSCGTCGTRFSKWLESVDAVMDHKYVFTNIGYNLKPLDLQGAIGLVQLQKFYDIECKRRYNFERIAEFIRATPGVRLAKVHLQADTCWFGVPIICDTVVLKDSFIQHLETHKIQTRPYFAGNILRHPAYVHLDDASKYPNANSVLDKVFFIGCPPQYTEEILNYIGEVIKKWQTQS
jgi:CDP-6-deoxy-D-xylo-4-hexulose-3-dehydrase